MKRILCIIYYLSFCFILSADIPELDEIMNFPINTYLSGLGIQNLSAQEINSLGFEAYQEDNLFKAAKLWRCALEKKPNHIWANYNYACALSLFAGQIGRDPASVNFMIEGGGDLELLMEYVNYIFYYLKKAISLDSAVFDRMLVDSDLDLIRNTFEYKMMLLHPDYDAVEILNYFGKWYSPGIGVFPGGTVEFTDTRVALQDVNKEADYEHRYTMKYGYITADGFNLTVHISSPQQETLYGKINYNKDEFGYIISVWLTIDGTYYSTEPDYGGV